MASYKGFSTVGRKFRFRLTDFELAKQDFINHLHIRQGEKLMDANFGTTIWDLLFENMSDSLRSDIVTELARIANYDPRLQVQNIDVEDFEKGIQVSMDILYTGALAPVSLRLAFETETQTVTEI